MGKFGFGSHLFVLYLRYVIKGELCAISNGNHGPIQTKRK